MSTDRLCGHLLSFEWLFRFRTEVGAGGDDIPWQELLDTVDGMVGEAGEHVA